MNLTSILKSSPTTLLPRLVPWQGLPRIRLGSQSLYFLFNTKET